MGSWRSVAAAAAGLLGLLWHLASSKNVQPTCNTDFDTELVCRWKVDAVTNCTAEFNVFYQYSANFSRKPRECPLKNEWDLDAASWCVCVIPENNFKNVKYEISLARTENDTKVWSNKTWDMDSIVKPKPLISLRVEKKKEDRAFILTWKRNYSESHTFHSSAANYEVAYWPQNHTEEKIIVPEDSTRHTIFVDKLRSDATYEASVRYRLKLWEGNWSEWSATCEWFNDFEASSEKISWKFVVCFCMIIVICLIVFCYLCFLWMKRKWWDGIPSPRKSKMAEDITTGKWLWIFGKMETVPCSRYVEQRVAGLASKEGQGRGCCSSAVSSKPREADEQPGSKRGEANKQRGLPLCSWQSADPCAIPSSYANCRPFLSKGGADLLHQPLSINREPFLIPEEVFLSKGSLTTDSSAGGVKPGSPEETEEETELVPHEGAVASLFRDLLRGTLSMEDPAPPATSAQSCSTPEKPVHLQGLCQPAYQACRVEPEGFGLELPLSGRGPYTPEGQADWLPRLESSPADSSCTALPQAESSLAAPSAPGYKSFSSLEAHPVNGFCPAWSQWPCLAPEGQSQQAWGSTGPGLLPLSETSGGFPAGQDAFSLFGAAAPGMWLFPEQQGEALRTCALQASGGPESLPGPKAAFFSSYRAFSCALQSSLASPEFSVEPV